MPKILLLLLFSAALLVASCGSHRQTVVETQEPVVIYKTDTVRSETVERVRIDTVTVTVEIPMQSAMQTVLDSLSHIETDFAESYAWINPDGSLGHSIRNKEKTIESDVYVPSTEKTSTEKESVTEQVPVYLTKTVTKEVERDFNWWESFRLSAFWWLLGAAILGWWLMVKIKVRKDRV